MSKWTSRQVERWIDSREKGRWLDRQTGRQIDKKPESVINLRTRQRGR